MERSINNIMAVEKFEALDRSGVKTLSKEIFSTIIKNFVKKTDLPDEVLRQNCRYRFRIDDKTGELWLQFPPDANEDIINEELADLAYRIQDVAPQE